MTYSLPEIVLNGDKIHFQEVVTNLGFKINSKLTCTDHIVLRLAKYTMPFEICTELPIYYHETLR